MLTLTVFINFLFVYSCISSDSDNIIFSRELIVNHLSDLKECTDASQCPFLDEYTDCDEGYGPDHEQATCINGKCDAIQRCSQDVIHSSIVISDSSTTSPTDQCQIDAQCSYIKQCVTECKENSGPLCAFSNCINRKCVITTPCSQTVECTTIDISHCITPKVCARCKPGYILPYAEASCENGHCKVIMRCTLFEESMTTTFVPLINTCIHDNQCPSPKICAINCSNDTVPLCASAKCENGNCIEI